MSVPQDRFTAKERRVVAKYGTPQKVQRYLNALPYNQERGKETLRTFRGVVQHHTAHCLEAALSAAVILEQHGYPPLLLDLESQDHLDHVLFLYRQQGKWGTVARSRDPGLHGRRPVFRNLRTLVKSYAASFVDMTGRIVGFGVYDLTELGKYDWRFSKRNVWRVQQALIDMPHEKFHMPDEDYRYWHERYRTFKTRHPHRKPFYYDGRRSWKPGYAAVK